MMVITARSRVIFFAGEKVPSALPFIMPRPVTKSTPGWAYAGILAASVKVLGLPLAVISTLFASRCNMMAASWRLMESFGWKVPSG